MTRSSQLYYLQSHNLDRKACFQFPYIWVLIVVDFAIFANRISFSRCYQSNRRPAENWVLLLRSRVFYLNNEKAHCNMLSYINFHGKTTETKYFIISSQKYVWAAGDASISSFSKDKANTFFKMCTIFAITAITVEVNL